MPKFGSRSWPKGTLARIQELASQLEQEVITAREFRSRMVAQLTILEDRDTKAFALCILGKGGDF